MYTVTLKGANLAGLIAQLRQTGSGNLPGIGFLVRDYAQLVRTRAVYNVSGYPVTYTGGSFVVRVRTGTLKGSLEMQWPYGSTYRARVQVNGTLTSEPGSVGGFISKPRPVSEYASAIEDGHEEIDLKKTMMGKTVPFIAARAQNARGPYAATGLMLGRGRPAQGPVRVDRARRAVGREGQEADVLHPQARQGRQRVLHRVSQGRQDGSRSSQWPSRGRSWRRRGWDARGRRQDGRCGHREADPEAG